MNTHTFLLSADGNYRCDNCGEIWKADELGRIENLDNRVDPGSIVPSGECPECRAFCYPAEIDSPELLNICKQIMKYVDRNGLPVNEDDIRVILPSELLRKVRTLIDPTPKK